MATNEHQTPQNVTGELIYPSTASIASKEITEIFEDIEDTVPMEDVTQPVLKEVSYNLFDNDSVKSIIRNQEIMLERQEQIMKELAVQKTMLQFILQNGDVSTDNNKYISNKVPNEKENIFPLTTTNDVEQFEINLLDVSYKTKIIENLSTMWNFWQIEGQ